MAGKNAAFSSCPLEFFGYLKARNVKLYETVVDYLIFEETSANRFRVQKLYKKDLWDLKTEMELDSIWFDYCQGHP